MKITNREAYVLGWVYGRACAAAYPKRPAIDANIAPAVPLSAMASAINCVKINGKSTPELEAEFTAALSEIESVPAAPVTEQETPQPLEKQSYWALGFNSGSNGSPIPEARKE